MPAPLDQGALGSCASNAASNSLRRLLHKAGLREWQPSRLYMYYNTRVNIEGAPAGQDTGVCIRDICKAVTKYHACEETVWPYDIAKFSVPPPLKAYQNANLHAGLVYQSVAGSLDVLRATLAAGNPIIAGIRIFDSFLTASVANTGVVPMPDPLKEACAGGHAVLICGYDDSKRTFLALNSWGSRWGMGGYFTLPYSYLIDPNLAWDMWVFTFFS